MAALPIIVTEFAKNSREIIRVTLDEFRGRPTIDVRVWYRDGDTLKPGRAGITVALAHLPSMAEGLQLALARAKVEGFLDG
jgi:hypothetical protein